MFKAVSLVIKFIRILSKAFTELSLLFFGQQILRRKLARARMREIARQEAQERMNEFLSVISHDLKTPLTSIKGNIQLVGRRLKNSPQTQLDEMQRLLAETREFLDRTDQQLNRLTRLVNALLESSRITANTMDLLFELGELDRLIKEAVQDVRGIPEERTIELNLPEETSVLIMADPTRIKQVIYQLLSNAHKYSAIDTRIEISLQKEGHLVRVQVQDQGIGIPTYEHRRIWERYYRIPGTPVLNGSEVGLGLGLYISRTIIEQHHGRVGVKSLPGEGSTFWFILPLAEQNLAIV